MAASRRRISRHGRPEIFRQKRRFFFFGRTERAGGGLTDGSEADVSRPCDRSMFLFLETSLVLLLPNDLREMLFVPASSGLVMLARFICSDVSE